MAEATFKDVPELFEVCVCSFTVLYFVLMQSAGRPRGSANSADRIFGWVHICAVTVSPSFNASSQATFRELGPPDLCYVVKSTGKSGQREVRFHFLESNGLGVTRIQLGSYHFVSGVDASSSASLAAYINSLTYAIEDNIAWFSKPAAWKVRNGCYWYADTTYMSEQQLIQPTAASTHSRVLTSALMSRSPEVFTHM